ncbi:hypothetical protein DM01DRAFT_1339496 [Hesseltinella vesiculosa]|uniref:Uncharacterized protein n=1 Tax=Hesseltinella vesiculosa TaxID=101127 RepID=A0A1X2G6P1_9FUNG|nr:hypothetical protein DM01DRAFT_1339496 [Hesseltinella vesiculosa]
MMLRIVTALFALMLVLVMADTNEYGEYWLDVRDDKMPQHYEFYTKDVRKCICLRTKRSDRIDNLGGGDVKVFSSSDCTGNYASIKEGGEIKNARWVNSASFGPKGTSHLVAC